MGDEKSFLDIIENETPQPLTEIDFDPTVQKQIFQTSSARSLNHVSKVLNDKEEIHTE